MACPLELDPPGEFPIVESAPTIPPKFGMPPEDALEALRCAPETEGIHAHVGSQLMDSGAALMAVDWLVTFAARARPHANSRDPGLSLPDVLHDLPGALHLRVPGPGSPAPMHLLARGGKSPERGGHRSQDALLVAAGTRSRPLTRA